MAPTRRGGELFLRESCLVAQDAERVADGQVSIGGVVGGLARSAPPASRRSAPRRSSTWHNDLAEDGRRARHTVNKIITQLHAISQHAVDHHELIHQSRREGQAAARVLRRRPRGRGDLR